MPKPRGNLEGAVARLLEWDYTMAVRAPSCRAAVRCARMLTHSAALAFALGVLALGCGGRSAVTGDGGDDGEVGTDDPTATSVGGRGNMSAGSPGSAGRPTRPLDFPETVAPCELGFRSRGPGERRCNYTFEGLCYENEVTACACACAGAICVIAGSQTLGDAPIGIVCQARPL